MENLKEFFGFVAKLKRIKRAGWLNHELPNTESVADHSYGTAVLAMLFAKRFGLDEAKVLKMALLHDLAESVVGDIITERGNEKTYSKEGKFEKEKAAMESILSNLGQQEKEELIALWTEGERGESKEAKLVRQLDKLEMALQAAEYQKENPSVNLEEFFIVAQKYVKDAKLKEVLKSLSLKHE